MTQGHNAGIKRNRRPTGTVALERKVYLSAETVAALDQARHDSGDLSLGLYLERLTAELRAERGTLPVLSPTLEAEEAHVSAA